MAERGCEIGQVSWIAPEPLTRQQAGGNLKEGVERS